MASVNPSSGGSAPDQLPTEPHRLTATHQQSTATTAPAAIEGYTQNAEQAAGPATQDQQPTGATRGAASTPSPQKAASFRLFEPHPSLWKYQPSTPTSSSHRGGDDGRSPPRNATTTATGGSPSRRVASAASLRQDVGGDGSGSSVCSTDGDSGGGMDWDTRTQTTASFSTNSAVPGAVPSSPVVVLWRQGVDAASGVVFWHATNDLHTTSWHLPDPRLHPTHLWECAECGTRNVLGHMRACVQCGSPFPDRKGGAMETKASPVFRTTTNSPQRSNQQQRTPHRTQHQHQHQHQQHHGSPLTPTLVERLPDWRCTACSSANAFDVESCSQCGAPHPVVLQALEEQAKLRRSAHPANAGKPLAAATWDPNQVREGLSAAGQAMRDDGHGEGDGGPRSQLRPPSKVPVAAAAPAISADELLSLTVLTPEELRDKAVHRIQRNRENELNLSALGLGGHVDAICAALRVNKILCALSLARNELKGDGAAAVSRTIASSKYLRTTLTGELCRLLLSVLLLCCGEVCATRAGGWVVTHTPLCVFLCTCCTVQIFPLPTTM